MPSMPVETFNPPNVPQPPPTYRQVARTSLSGKQQIITLAGQVGIDVKTGKVVDNFQDQVRLAYENLVACLEAAGATPKDIVHVRHYIVTNTGNAELDALDILDRGWGEQWTKLMDSQADGHRPPDTVVGVASLAKKALLYEVEVWAVV